jgi:hypothetical protein
MPQRRRDFADRINYREQAPPPRQPIGAVVTNARAALRWLGGQPPDLEEVRQALDDIVKDGNRAGDVIGRISARCRTV